MSKFRAGFAALENEQEGWMCCRGGAGLSVGAQQPFGRQLHASGVAGGARRHQRLVPGLEPFRLVATEMDRGVNGVIEAEPVMELSCFISIKSALYPAMSLEGDGEVTVTK